MPSLLVALERDGLGEDRVRLDAAERLHLESGLRFGSDGLVPDGKGGQAQESVRVELGPHDVHRPERPMRVDEGPAERLLVLVRTDPSTGGFAGGGWCPVVAHDGSVRFENERSLNASFGL